MGRPPTIEFEPVERARRRFAIAAIGLAMWIAALSTLAVVLLGIDQSGAALVITLGSFVLALVLLAISATRYRRRLR